MDVKGRGRHSRDGQQARRAMGFGGDVLRKERSSGEPSSSGLQSTKACRGRFSRSIASTQFEESFVWKLPRPSLAVGRVSLRRAIANLARDSRELRKGREVREYSEGGIGLDVAVDGASGAQWSGGEGGKTKEVPEGRTMKPWTWRWIPTTLEGFGLVGRNFPRRPRIRRMGVGGGAGSSITWEWANGRMGADRGGCRACPSAIWGRIRATRVCKPHQVRFMVCHFSGDWP